MHKRHPSLNSSDISSNANLLVPNATLYEFGVLTSQMHMAWMRTVCGRLEMRYRYSAQIVYNNFSRPDVSEAQKAAIIQKAQAVLDARSQFPDSSLADLYDPNTMPPVLTKAYTALDSAVDKLYRKAAFRPCGFFVRAVWEEDGGVAYREAETGEEVEVFRVYTIFIFIQGE